MYNEVQTGHEQKHVGDVLNEHLQKLIDGQYLRAHLTEIVFHLFEEARIALERGILIAPEDIRNFLVSNGFDRDEVDMEIEFFDK